jgi:hypothetical protein
MYFDIYINYISCHSIFVSVSASHVVHISMLTVLRVDSLHRITIIRQNYRPYIILHIFERF